MNTNKEFASIENVESGVYSLVRKSAIEAVEPATQSDAFGVYEIDTNEEIDFLLYSVVVCRSCRIITKGAVYEVFSKIFN